MTLLKDSPTSRIIFIEGTPAGTPDAGEVWLYVKADGLLYMKDDAGVEVMIGTGYLVQAEGDLLIGTAPMEMTYLPIEEEGYILTSRSSRPAWVPQYSTINIIIEGGGVAITTGVKGDVVVDFACRIVSWSLLADASGAIKVDIWKDTYASFAPTDADSIANGHEPEIAASGIKAQDMDLSDWTTVDIAAGDVLRVNVDSCATIMRCTLTLKVLRT